MRADRLLSILLILQNKGSATARELAERLEVSARTIHRDMEALSASGVPVYADRGQTGGWKLAEGYRTNLTGLKSNEMSALLLAAPTLLADLGLLQPFENAVEKLLASAPAVLKGDAEYARERLHVDGAGWHQSSEPTAQLQIVQEALWLERKLRIKYQRSGDGETVERIVLPLGLVAKRSTWYLVAQAEQEFRTYRVSRVVDAEMLDERFDRPNGFNLAAYWQQSTEEFKMNLPRYTARLLVTKTTVARLKRENYVTVIQCSPSERDEWYEATLQFHTLETAGESVLGFGDGAVVLEPVELRDYVLGQARNILERYEGEEI